MTERKEYVALFLNINSQEDLLGFKNHPNPTIWLRTLLGTFPTTSLWYLVLFECCFPLVFSLNSQSYIQFISYYFIFVGLPVTLPHYLLKPSSDYFLSCHPRSVESTNPLPTFSSYLRKTLNLQTPSSRPIFLRPLVKSLSTPMIWLMKRAYGSHFSSTAREYLWATWLDYRWREANECWCS